MTTRTTSFDRKEQERADEERGIMLNYAPMVEAAVNGIDSTVPQSLQAGHQAVANTVDAAPEAHVQEAGRVARLHLHNAVVDPITLYHEHTGDVYEEKRAA